MAKRAPSRLPSIIPLSGPALDKAAAPSNFFGRFSRLVSKSVGTPSAFVAACVIVAVWAVTGPLFHFSDTWQLCINTGTTIVTFLMVFLIQATQNHDARAVHLKLNEIIRALGDARNSMLDLEDLPDEELTRFAEEFEKLRQRAVETKRARDEKGESISAAP